MIPQIDCIVGIIILSDPEDNGINVFVRPSSKYQKLWKLIYLPEALRNRFCIWPQRIVICENDRHQAVLHNTLYRQPDRAIGSSIRL